MARETTKWPSNRGPITKIMPSDGCKGDAVPLAMGQWYIFHEFGCHLGNVGSSLAKCFANEIAREVTGAAVQLMGGYGYSKEYVMERRLRDAWGWGIAGGTIDIQKINIAAALVGRRFDQRR